MNTLIDVLQPMATPLAIVLIGLLALRQVRDDVRPIFSGIVSGVAKSAQSNALAYAIALGFGLSASFSAFWEVFHTLDSTSLSVMSWHQYAALWTKVLNPFIVAILAYATKSDFKGFGQLPAATNINPPFPATPTL